MNINNKCFFIDRPRLINLKKYNKRCALIKSHKFNIIFMLGSLLKLFVNNEITTNNSA